MTTFYLWYKETMFNKANPIHRFMRKLLPKKYRCSYDHFNFEMTVNLANFIKFLRCRKKNKYEDVAKYTKRMYVNLDISNQYLYEGYALCEYARIFLNEPYNKKWSLK